MTQEEKVKYFQLALNVCKFGFTEQQTDLMVKLYDLMIEKKGDSSIRDIFLIKAENAKAFKPQEDENIQGKDS